MSLIDNILTELERIRDERGTHANTATRVGTALIDLLSLISGIGNSKLSKTDDDTASGEIGFQKGLWVKMANGASKVIELLPSGLAKVKSLLVNGTWGIDDDGDATLYDVAANDVTARDAAMRDVTGRDAEFENLRVTKEAHFFRLVVDEMLSNKGAIIISSANCVVEAKQEDQSTYTVYFSNTDKDGIAVNNPWVVGDHALCLTFKGEGAGTFSDVKNRYYWRKVVYVYSDITYEGKTYHAISLSKTIGEGSTEPAAGDSIVQLGYSGQTSIPARQTAIILSAYQTMDVGDNNANIRGLVPPSFAFYKGVNDFALSSHRYTYMDGVANEFFGDFKVLVNNSYTSMTTLLATTNRLIAEIRNDLGTVGVDINGDDMAINLKAGKVNFLMPDGSTNAKISIDPTTGTLHAVDGVFEGTVKANNLYRALAIASKRENTLVFTPGGESRMWVFVKGSDNYIHPDTGKEYTVGEYYEISIAEFFSLYAYPEFSSYFSVCIGPADEVVITSISGLPYEENSFSLNLPRSQDFNGKVVTISNIIANSTVRVYQCDGSATGFSTTGISLVRDGNDETIEIDESAHMQSYLDIAAGEVATFYSVGAYWIRLRVIDSGINGSAVTQQWVMDYVTQNAVTIATLAGYATQQWVSDHFLTSFTETDPTVPSWAKQSSKPSYQFSEIGGSVAASQLPTLYWANVAISNQSNNNTSPQFGELRLRPGSNNYGSYLYFGDYSYCYLQEDSDDHLKIHADNGIELSVGSNYSVTYGGYEIATQSWVSNQGFLISSAISDMATQTWVQNTAKAHEAVSADSATYASRLQGSNSGTTNSAPSAYSLTDTYARVYSETVKGTSTAGGTSDSYEQRLTFALVGGYVNGRHPVQLSLSDSGIFFRTSSTSSTWNSWNKIWHSGNDGSGSGLDADTVDGIEGSALLQKSGITIQQTISGGDQSRTLGDIYAINMPFTISDGYELNPAYLPLSDVGTQNGKVLRLAEFPSYVTIKANSNYNQDYNRIDGNVDPDDYSDEAYFKGLVRWAIAEYANTGGAITLMGDAEPNSAGTAIINLYSSSGYDNTSKLPRYCSGRYITLGGNVIIFGTTEYTWYWHYITPSEIATQSWVNSQGHVASAGALKDSGNTKVEATSVGATVTGVLRSTAGFTVDNSSYNISVKQSLDVSGSWPVYNIQFLDTGTATANVCTFAFNGTVESSNGFKKTGSSDDYVLLGGGGTKAVTDFATWMDRPLTARGLNVAGDSTLAAPHVRVTYDYVSAGRFSMNFKGYAGDSLVAPISYIFDAPITQGSDMRRKEVTDYLEPSVYDVASAPLVRFSWRGGDGRELVGTSAQYWQRVVPELVGETQEGWLTMDYQTAGVVAGVTAARKAVELERRIEEQDRRIEELEQIINQLKGN